jgi:hypothetical protein
MLATLKEMVPNVEYTNLQDTKGTSMSIDKTGPGQGLGRHGDRQRNRTQGRYRRRPGRERSGSHRGHVIGSRWQPHPASAIIEKTFGLMTDPSHRICPQRKIVIDATRQIPGEVQG